MVQLVLSLALGRDKGCLTTNPTCNATQLVNDNLINTVQPVLVNPAAGNYKLSNVSAVSGKVAALPSMNWSGSPSTPQAPTTSITNGAYTHYRDGSAVSSVHPGAY
jgi:hypothetical protein